MIKMEADELALLLLLLHKEGPKMEDACVSMVPVTSNSLADVADV